MGGSSGLWDFLLQHTPSYLFFLFSSHLSTFSFKNNRNALDKYLSYTVRQEDVSPISSLSTSEPKGKKVYCFQKHIPVM